MGSFLNRAKINTSKKLLAILSCIFVKTSFSKPTTTENTSFQQSFLIRPQFYSVSDKKVSIYTKLALNFSHVLKHVGGGSLKRIMVLVLVVFMFATAIATATISTPKINILDRTSSIEDDVVLFGGDPIDGVLPPGVNGSPGAGTG